MNDFNTFQNDTEFIDDFKCGLGRLMMTKVGAVNIQPLPIVTAFIRFVNKNRVGDTFYVADLAALYQKEQIKKLVCGRLGEAIISVSGSIVAGAMQKKIVSSSVCGLYELILRTEGFALDVSETEYKDLTNTRFYFCKQNRADIMVGEMLRCGLQARRIGVVGGDGNIAITVDGITRVDIAKSELIGTESITVNIGTEYTEYYTRSVIETTNYATLFATGFAKYLDIGHGGDIESLIASLLGVYAAQFTFEIPTYTCRYHSGYTVAVRRSFDIQPQTYVTLFGAGDGRTGAVNAQSLQQLMRVLRSYACEGLIYGVIPVRNQISGCIGQLPEGLSFVRYANAPENAPAGSVLVLSHRLLGGIRIGEIK